MLQLYKRYWWSFLIRGIIAVLFGLAAIILPRITLDILAILVAAFLIADGIISLIASLSGKALDTRWWLLFLEGLAGIIIGIFAFTWPGMTILAIILIIGFWAVLTGVLEIAAAIKLRHEITNEWLLGSGGALSILFGIILFIRPGLGAVAMVWLIGAYALIFGFAMILLGLKLRKHSILISAGT